MKDIPSGVMHEPRTMAWAQLTTTGEIKKMAEENALEVLPLNWPENTKKEPVPVPVSVASLSLRRAYPYIFNCAAYVATHYPERIKDDGIYKYFEMPYDVFLNYCLDSCTEQTEDLKNELYPLFRGRPAKYIKVSQDKAVFACPINIAFFYAELKTGKEKRIEKIGHDHRVNKVRVYIIKELLSFEKGYINLPKAPYAKIKHIYNKMRNYLQSFLDNKDNYRGMINHVKGISTGPISTNEAARVATITLAQGKILEEIEQGGFYKVYRAIEYIAVNRNGAINKQNYNFLEICGKCAPNYIYEKDGKLFYKDRLSAIRFCLLIAGVIDGLEPEDRDAIGIESIKPHKERDEITVTFTNHKRGK